MHIITFTTRSRIRVWQVFKTQNCDSSRLTNLITALSLFLGIIFKIGGKELEESEGWGGGAWGRETGMENTRLVEAF